MVLDRPGKLGVFIAFSRRIFATQMRTFSLHNFGVNHLLNVLPIYLGKAAVPDVVVIGAEVSLTFRLSDRLTPTLAASLNETVERIIDECMS